MCSCTSCSMTIRSVSIVAGKFLRTMGIQLFALGKIRICVLYRVFANGGIFRYLKNYSARTKRSILEQHTSRFKKKFIGVLCRYISG